MDSPGRLTTVFRNIRISTPGPIFATDDSVDTAVITNSTPERAVRRIQREDASLSTPKPHPCSARNLLLGVFKKGWERPTTVEKLRTAHVDFLLKTTIGRDFNLITAAGVEFKVHSTMLIGGAKTLQDELFSSDALRSDPPKHVILPPHFHPILMDRIVNFIYTSDYTISTSRAKPITKLSAQNFTFHNATFIPPIEPPTPAMIALAGIQDCIFHLHIYHLGEDLQYPSLKSAAYAKLTDLLIRQRGRDPSVLKETVDAVFAAPGSSTRICADEDSVIQQLVVAAAIGHEQKCWTDKQREQFVALLPAAEYKDFWSVHDTTQSENIDMINENWVCRQYVEEKRRAKQAVAKRASGGALSVAATGSPAKDKAMAAGFRTESKRRHKDRFKRRHVPRAKVELGRAEEEDDKMEMEVD
ncbi:hypothetical protein IAQ61_001813 [Plenodomus lingam]|uniref:BTB domain-containing protein n=1 Tax=Leptosphaeria maculans (strain JN3 / isolate v23.1.3 / race Av1-4-5-6-7-8) TaxID=985895 RepID=E4ZG98_LEPMJ|nr:hypothetical protein LEMA_P064440.1 [Plenodomus lingam JN3]KAH9878541.1 hypothetical protein IAQ61_001813 [Plenodomus lingam]CBX90318.1 hypothetical protein LEMA_P064440.1 [Plenodomus lingam JN3]